MMHIEIDRQANAAQREDLAAALGRVLAEVRQAVGDWRAMRGRGARCCRGSEAPSREWRARGRGAGVPALARGQPLHLPRLSPLPLRRGRRAGRRHALRGDSRLGARHPAARRVSACSMRGWAAARRCARFARGPAAAADRQDRPRVAGPSPRRDGLRHRQDPRRRRAASPASGGSSASSPRPPITRRRSTCRCCAAASKRCWRAPASIPAAMTARRCWPSSTPIRATSCSRSTTDTLYDHALGILQLQERQRVALFVRRDPVGRFASCLVFAPRERFDAAVERPLPRHPAGGLARHGDLDHRLGQHRLARSPRRSTR